MRAREFIMKDAYSFHIDEASLREGYDAMHDAYTRIFTRMGLKFRSVAADSRRDRRQTSRRNSTCSRIPARTPSRSPTATTTPPTSRWPWRCAAGGAARRADRSAERGGDARREAPSRTVAKFLEAAARSTVKTIASRRQRTAASSALLVRGDHELNAVKAQKLAGCRQPLAHVVERHRDRASATGAEPGFLGPVGLQAP